MVVELGAGQKLRVLSTGSVPGPSTILVRGNEGVCKFNLFVYKRVGYCFYSCSNILVSTYIYNCCVWRVLIKFLFAFMMEGDLCGFILTLLS